MHPTVHHFTWNMHAHIRERKISCSFFFCQEEKLSSPRKRIWWPTIYISCISSEKLENIFLSINNLGKKERHSLTRKLARALVAHAHAHLYRILNKYKAGVFRCIIRGLVVFFSERKCYEKLERIPNIGRVCEIADKHVTFLIQELFWSVSAWS